MGFLQKFLLLSREYCINNTSALLTLQFKSEKNLQEEKSTRFDLFVGDQMEQGQTPESAAIGENHLSNNSSDTRNVNNREPIDAYVSFDNFNERYRAHLESHAARQEQNPNATKDTNNTVATPNLN